MDNIDIKTLDTKTLEFARDIIWQYRYLCPKTKAGNIEAQAYDRVFSTLVNYIQKVDELNS